MLHDCQIPPLFSWKRWPILLSCTRLRHKTSGLNATRHGLRRTLLRYTPRTVAGTLVLLAQNSLSVTPPKKRWPWPLLPILTIMVASRA